MPRSSILLVWVVLVRVTLKMARLFPFMTKGFAKLGQSASYPSSKPREPFSSSKMSLINASMTSGGMTPCSAMLSNVAYRFAHLSGFLRFIDFKSTMYLPSTSVYVLSQCPSRVVRTAVRLSTVVASTGATVMRRPGSISRLTWLGSKLVLNLVTVLVTREKVMGVQADNNKREMRKKRMEMGVRAFMGGSFGY